VQIYPEEQLASKGERDMAYQVVSKTETVGTGGGPRVVFSDDGGAVYMIIGAYDGINNIVNVGRTLVIQINGGLRIVGLTTPPLGTHISDLVADNNGNVYVQP
jgi:hypothetical protein